MKLNARTIFFCAFVFDKVVENTEDLEQLMSTIRRLHGSSMKSNVNKIRTFTTSKEHSYKFIKLDNVKLKQVRSFKYLRSPINAKSCLSYSCLINVR